MDAGERRDIHEGVLGVSNAAAIITLPVMPPFHLEGTVRVLQRHPRNRVDHWYEGRYVRALPTRTGARLVTVENLGSIDAPNLRCLVFGGAVSPSSLVETRWTIQRILGLDVDLAPFYGLAHQSSRVQAAIEALRGLRPPRFPSLFETIVNVVPFQQVSLAAGVAVVGRIVTRFGEPLRVNQQQFYVFPEPEAFLATDQSELRTLGLSRAKSDTLHDLALRIMAGELHEEQLEMVSTEAAMAILTALRGIGPWSAGLVLLRGLRRLEIFPDGDIGALNNLARLLGLSPPVSMAELRLHIESMGNTRGLLYFYALGWRLLQEGLITSAPGAAC